jgi:hypothetical protein
MRVVKPKEWHTTRSGGTALRALVLMPAVFVLSVAFEPRPATVDSYDLTYSERADADMMAYIPVVKDTQATLRADRTSADKLRQVADEWVAGTQSGELRPLVQQRADDSILQGVKSEVYSALRDLTSSLDRMAIEELRKGHPKQAIMDWTQSAMVAQGLKYSDMTSVALLGSHQRRMLRQINTNLPKLSPEDRNAVEKKLEFIRPDEEAFKRVCRLDYHFQIIEIARRREIARAGGKLPVDALKEPAESKDTVAARSESQLHSMLTL